MNIAADRFTRRRRLGLAIVVAWGRSG